MNSTWSKKWKKVLIWFSAYMSFIAFALVGGYTIVKNEDDELKKTSKVVLIVSLIFAALSGFSSLFYNFAGFSDNFYSSGAYEFYSNLTSLLNIAKIVVFAVFIIIELVKRKRVETKTETPAVEEKN